MKILAFYVIIFIIQIYNLLKFTKVSSKTNQLRTLITILMSILFTIAFTSSCKFILMNKNAEWAALYFVESFVALITYIIMLIIFIVVNINKDIVGKTDVKNLILGASLFLMIFIFFSLLELVPCVKTQIIERNLEKNAKIKVIQLLNEKYGDGDFKIANMYEENISESYIQPIDGYHFIVSTKYFDGFFDVELNKSKMEISKDNFLSIYYRKNYDIKNLDEYLKEYALKKVQDRFNEKYNVNINFERVVETEYQKLYGRVPDIDDLSKEIKLYNPIIEIKIHLQTKEELIDYLIELLNIFVTNADDFNFNYTINTTAFSFKYDNGTNKYNGTVMLGTYEYSDEFSKYVIVNKSSVARITIMNKIIIVNLKNVNPKS